MVVISLFDGMSCGQLAFKKLGIEFDGIKDKYFASEIKPIAIKVTKDNFPNTIHIGDVTKIRFENKTLITENGNYNLEREREIVLIGGSPCQDFSSINMQQLGLNGEKSKLFHEYLRLLNEINPKYFLLENVKMKKSNKKLLDNYLKTEGVMIDSRYFSYQKRRRYYWTNIPILIFADKNINFQDFKETDNEICKQYKLKRTKSRIKMWNNGNGSTDIKTCNNVTHSDKICCLTRVQDRAPNSGLIEFEDFCRYLTRKELEMAQNVPLGYTKCLSYIQSQDVLGDGWTVDVIAHIFLGIDNEKINQLREEYIKLNKELFGNSLFGDKYLN